MSRTITKCVATTVITALAATSFAGDLNPSPGPVSPTMKPLTQIEPRIAVNAVNTPGDADSFFKITSPGSYYLTGLVLVPPGKMGIEIATDDVTLDLSGFRVAGIAGTLDGIRATGTHRRAITIRNGRVINCQGTGISFRPDSGVNWSTGCRVENVTISLCGRGLELGYDSIAERVICMNNVGTGMYCLFNCTISHCIAGNNGGRGIDVESNCTVSECTAALNGETGISSYGSSNVVRCIAYYNGDSGISAGSFCRVEACLLTFNVGGGIRADFGNQILNNNCQSNGLQTDGAAIAVATNNRIEGNQCMVSAYGIRTYNNANVIIRNTCSRNTLNWSISENNYYGPIINRVNVTTAAVSGDAAAGTLATTDPHANFTH